MNTTTIVSIAAVVILAILVGVLIYLYIRNRTLDEIREDVYNLFLLAEHKFKSGEGQLKMDYVIRMARNLLPPWAQLFITESMLKTVIQLWFDSIKDLLDDGKYNGSADDDLEIIDLDL